MGAIQQRLPKNRRAPEAVAGNRVTERGIEIVKTVARYRFLLARDIVRLVGGNEDVTHRHLQQLYHQDLVGRFILPELARRGEFIYFLDNPTGLRQLTEVSKLDTEKLPWFEIRQNREKYSQKEFHSIGRFLFIHHELMISAFHADLEVAVRSDAIAEIERWVQGPSLWSSVSDGRRRTLPHRPDAFFTLRFLNAPEGQQLSNFFYEADRNTCNLTRIRQKLEAHLLFFMQGKHTERYGIRKVRAVLIETTSEQRTEQMRATAKELAVTTPIANHLFWFANSGERPAFVRRWRSGGDDRLKSLLD